jgi:hypothetical protein
MSLILGILAQSASAIGGANSYESIITTTLTSSQTYVDFSGLDTSAADYKHLQIRYFIPSTPSAGDNIYMKLGSGSIDSGSNYAWHNIAGYGGGSASASAESGVTIMRLLYQNITEAAAFPVSGVTDILDFASTSKTKVVRTLIGREANNVTSAWSVVSLMSGLWNSTNAVKNLRIAYGGGQLPINTKIAIYGIKD